MDFDNLTNPHDRFFRESMQRIELALCLIRMFLDSQISDTIDFSSFELVKDTWVDTELSAHYADILYRATTIGNNGYIFVLFEHKSYVDPKTPIQNLRNIDNIWAQIEKQEVNITKFPVVISIIVYHGDKPWDINNSTKPIIEITKETEKFVPDYKSLIIDLSIIRDNEINGTFEFKAFLIALKYARSEQIFIKLPEIIRLFNRKSKKAQKYLSVVLIYIGSVIHKGKKTTFLQIIKQKYIGGEEYMKSVVDSLREEGFRIGVEEGKKEGKKEGNLEGKLEGKLEEQLIIADRLIHKNMSKKEIHELTGLSMKRISDLILKLKK